MATTLRTPGSSLRFAEVTSPSNDTLLKDMQILKTGRFFDPRYKWFEITEKVLAEMVQNFQVGVRGIVPALDYAHESEGAAAGWIKELFLKDSETVGQKELWGKVELTPRGQKTLSDKEFGYISADFEDNYQDNETGKKHGAVLLGAALTNRPVIKKMDAVIQLSEENDGKKTEMKGDIMDPKEMEKKLADMETKCSEADKKLADMNGVLAAAGVSDLEALMKWIADMKAKSSDKAPAEAEVELGEVKKELAETKTKLSLVEKKAQDAEKEVEFAKLFSEGKLNASQKEAFITGDVKKLMELQTPIKLSEDGSSNNSGSGSGDVEEEILKEAKKLSEEKKLPIGKAISQVLMTNKALADKRKALQQ